MERPSWVPEGIDITRPSIARAYDYLLGGSHSLAVDREYTRNTLALMPEARLVAQANRAFMHRAVRFMVAAGIRQFLDIGSGIPTVGNVHEIAQKADARSRVVYVDRDPVAVAHSEQILAGNPQAVIIEQDARDPQAILDHPDTQRLIDFTEPIGLLLVALLHAVPDEAKPAEMVTRLHESLPPGSYVAISHGTQDSQPELVEQLNRLTANTTTPTTPRSHAEVESFFTGLELLDPGLVWAPLWRPEPGDDVHAPERLNLYAGVGYKA